MKYDLVISINVHEKPEYLLTQIENIKQYVSLKTKVILNCNDFMLNELTQNPIENVDAHPVPISKRTFHGSLLQGIVCNMDYALNNYDFDYFLVMSSREFFYRNLTSTSQIEEHLVDERMAPVRTGPPPGRIEEFTVPNYYQVGDYDRSDWWWHVFKYTKLFSYIKENNLNYSHSMHEGMCYSKKVCEDMIDFFRNNIDIMSELFNFDGCVEEFALQTISVALHPTKSYYYIGNGCDTKSLDQVDPTKFTYKRVR